MCGIILAAKSSALLSTDIGLFENLLFMDTIRGVHATGVIAGYHIPVGNETYSIVGKEPVPAPMFLASDTWKSVSSQKYKTTYNTEISRNPKFLVGHNRHATRGAKTAENAHPFVQGDVTLVHNGTLTDQSHLPDHSKFEVDSNNICHSINKIGAAETIQKLDGAFTLIWHDVRDQTLNIIRNEERPFHLARTSTNGWFGASEEEMLMWILNRDDKYSFSKTSPKIAEHFECEVGVQYVFDVSGDKFEPKTLRDETGKIIPDSWKIKHELPKFPPKYNYSRYNSYNYDYSYTRDRNKTSESKSAYQQTAGATAANELLEKEGLKQRLNDHIWFEGLYHKPYPGRPTHGMLQGWVENTNNYIEVQCHSHPTDMFEEGGKYYAQIISAYYLAGVTHIVVKEASFEGPDEESNLPMVIENQTFIADESDDALAMTALAMIATSVIEDDDKEEEVPDQVLMEDGELYSKDDWDQLPQSICSNCNTQIPFEEAEHARAVPGGYICQPCVEELEEAVTMEAFGDDDAPFLDKFLCTMCGTERDASEESPTSSTCNSCYNSFYSYDNSILSNTNYEDRTIFLDDGSFATKSDWEQINTCVQCGNKIDFEKADMCSVRKQGVLCPTCIL